MGSAEEAGEEHYSGYDQDLYAYAMEFVPATAILQPAWVGLLGIHLRYAGVDRDEHGYAEDDGCRPEDCSNCDEGSGTACDGAMLIGCAEDQQEGQSVPEGYGFAQDACKRRGDLGVSAVVQLSELPFG